MFRTTPERAPSLGSERSARAFLIEAFAPQKGLSRPNVTGSQPTAQRRIPTTRGRLPERPGIAGKTGMTFGAFTSAGQLTNVGHRASTKRGGTKAWEEGTPFFPFAARHGHASAPDCEPFVGCVDPESQWRHPQTRARAKPQSRTTRQEASCFRTHSPTGCFSRARRHGHTGPSELQRWGVFAFVCLSRSPKPTRHCETCPRNILARPVAADLIYFVRAAIWVDRRPRSRPRTRAGNNVVQPCFASCATTPPLSPTHRHSVQRRPGRGHNDAGPSCRAVGPRCGRPRPQDGRRRRRPNPPGRAAPPSA